MRQIDKTKKTGILRKFFIKISRLLGYELIDQADLTFVTTLKDNPSEVGKKSITLPLGEVKITRRVESFDIIIKTCTLVNLVTQNKNRVFEAKKSEYTFRTINSIIQSIDEVNKKTSNVNFKITVIDAGSSDKDLQVIKELLIKSSYAYDIIKLDLNVYSSRIKLIKKNNSQIEKNMMSTMASIIRSFEISKKAKDLVYFVEDDYIHSKNSILEMISVYEKFSSILSDELFLVPVDYPYLYQKKISSNILIGYKYHWRSVKESLLTFLTSKQMINRHFNDLIKMGEIEHNPYEKILHDIYDKENCFSPIPSLALHCANINSVYGLSPNIDFKKMWEDSKI